MPHNLAIRSEKPFSFELGDIIARKDLNALFQPIINMGNGQIVGYEGLIRGPSDSPLHSPLALFKVAEENGLMRELEQACRQVVLQRFVEQDLPGKLFLNVSPGCLLQPVFRDNETLDYINEVGLSPSRVIIELTEHQPTYDYTLLREAAVHYRSMGFEIGMDDVGEGFSSLRLWSELRPEYVKIDMHFIQGINQDPVKLQFVHSLQQIAEKSGCKGVIAEGIETHAEMMIIKDLGIAFGQGYHVARPNSIPPKSLPEISKVLKQGGITVYPQTGTTSFKSISAAKLLVKVTPVTPKTSHEIVYQMFVADPNLNAVPVVENGLPVGIINRTSLIDRFARPFRRELMGRKACAVSMDSTPLVVDVNMSVQELSQRIVEAGRHYLSDGFIITDKGEYVGMGTGHDLMREITQMQINAARYANPLTQLPGNVPISEHIDRLLESRVPFCACYCDIDNFKPFNDVYGYRKGDDMIQMAASILVDACDPERDFVGHIGGDDFVCLFQSDDWELRCSLVLLRFSQEANLLFNEEHVRDNGYSSEDRQGNKVFHPLSTLSIGVVAVEPGAYGSHQDIAAALSEAKKLAKRTEGNSIFIERRGS